MDHESAIKYHYYYYYYDILNRVPTVILLNKLQKFKGALFFLYCELYVGNIVQL